MTYTINPQASQDSLTAELRAQYPHAPVIPGGLLDDDSSTIKKYDTGAIKPFITINFQTPRRTRRGRSLAGVRLDQRVASADIMVVARSEAEARLFMNDIIDRIIGFKPVGSGAITESERQLWGDARQLEVSNRPSRWVMSFSVDWGIFSKKVL